MSYEGYVQAICTNGHYYTYDAFADDGEIRCTCGAQASWNNSVDDTNCDSYGEIPLDLLRRHFQREPAVTETCPHCQHVKLVTEETFRVPDRETTRLMRHHRPGYGGTPLVPIES